MMRSLVPKLRFDGFSGEWEENILKSFGDFKGGGTPSKQIDEYWKGDIPWISSSDINKDNINYINISKFINEKSIKESATKIIPKNSILFVSRVGVGKLAINKQELCTSQDFINFTPYEINSYYLGYFFIANKNLLDIFNQGTSIKGFRKSDLETLKIKTPKPKEQQKIANTLSSLDNLIEAQKKKVEALKKHKKGLMQQLFPREGEKEPKLRFEGFSGEWEENTLLELAKFRRGSFPQPYGLPEWYDDKNGMPFIQVFDVSDNLKLKPTTKRKISKLGAKQSVFIPKDTLIVTIQGSIGRVAVTQYDAYIDRTLLLFEKFHQEIDILFFAYTIENLFKIEKEKAPGGIIKTITKEVLSNFIVKLPSFTEQQKIANTLSSLDNLIETQNKKIEALKKHKKGLMQQMFVSA